MAQLQLPFKYYCVRKDGTGGRCINPAILILEGTRWHDCIEHLREDDPPMAPSPEWLLFQFFVNWKFQEKYLGNSEVYKTERDSKAQILKRIIEAERIGRNYRHFSPDLAHIGCPVFGRGGLHEVGRIDLLRQEIEREGYVLVSQHWYERDNSTEGGAVLVCGFRRNPSPEAMLATPVTYSGREIFEMLLKDGWMCAHIHANAPDETGEMVHSVELIGRREKSAKKECLVPVLNDGMWWALPRSVAETEEAENENAAKLMEVK